MIKNIINIDSNESCNQYIHSFLESLVVDNNSNIHLIKDAMDSTDCYWISLPTIVKQLHLDYPITINISCAAIYNVFESMFVVSINSIKIETFAAKLCELWHIMQLNCLIIPNLTWLIAL